MASQLRLGLLPKRRPWFGSFDFDHITADGATIKSRVARVQSTSGESGGGFLSTHPATADRIDALKEGQDPFIERPKSMQPELALKATVRVLGKLMVGARLAVSTYQQIAASPPSDFPATRYL